jgi:hypothetical protein
MATTRVHRPGRWVDVLIDMTVLLCVLLFILGALWLGLHLVLAGAP